MDARALRGLPSVDGLAAEVRRATPNTTEREATAAAQAVLSARRAELHAGRPNGSDALVSRAQKWLQPGLTRVLNATGVIVHTNLGRAPLAAAAVEATARAGAGYVDLEHDLLTGGRGHRDVHVSSILCELTGAEDALAVNNGAGATLLAAAALGGPNRSIAVSRGHLVEVGGGFRIPDVVALSGARLVEVGTTNRTRLSDYAEAGADVLLRVHQSNFRIVGFVEDVSTAEITTLGLPVIDDVGSGVLDTGIFDNHDEPTVRASVTAGAALVTFSGDKVLGGPQAGLIVGAADAVAACRRHPLARALRIGRLPMAALIATLALYRDPARARREIPVLAMLTTSDTDLRERSEYLAAASGGKVVEVASRVGGGALPLLELRGPGVAVQLEDPHRLKALLRACRPPLLARVHEGALLLDPRTLEPEDVSLAGEVLTVAREFSARATDDVQR